MPKPNQPRSSDSQEKKAENRRFVYNVQGLVKPSSEAESANPIRRIGNELLIWLGYGDLDAGNPTGRAAYNAGQVSISCNPNYMPSAAWMAYSQIGYVKFFLGAQYIRATRSGFFPIILSRSGSSARRLPVEQPAILDNNNKRGSYRIAPPRQNKQLELGQTPRARACSAQSKIGSSHTLRKVVIQSPKKLASPRPASVQSRGSRQNNKLRNKIVYRIPTTPLKFLMFCYWRLLCAWEDIGALGSVGIVHLARCLHRVPDRFLPINYLFKLLGVALQITNCTVIYLIFSFPGRSLQTVGILPATFFNIIYEVGRRIRVKCHQIHRTRQGFANNSLSERQKFLLERNYVQLGTSLIAMLIGFAMIFLTLIASDELYLSNRFNFDYIPFDILRNGINLYCCFATVMVICSLTVGQIGDQLSIMLDVRKQIITSHKMQKQNGSAPYIGSPAMSKNLTSYLACSRRGSGMTTSPRVARVGDVKMSKMPSLDSSRKQFARTRSRKETEVKDIERAAAQRHKLSDAKDKELRTTNVMSLGYGGVSGGNHPQVPADSSADLKAFQASTTYNTTRPSGSLNNQDPFNKQRTSGSLNTNAATGSMSSSRERQVQLPYTTQYSSLSTLQVGSSSNLAVAESKDPHHPAVVQAWAGSLQVPKLSIDENDTATYFTGEDISGARPLPSIRRPKT